MAVKKNETATVEKKHKRKIGIGDLIELYNEGAFSNEPVGKAIAAAMEIHLRTLIVSYREELTKLAEAHEANGEIVYTPIYFGKGGAGVRKAIAEGKEAEELNKGKRKIGFTKEE